MVFKEIDLNNPEDYYEGSIELDGREIELDLNIERESIEQSLLEKINAFIEKLGEFDRQNRNFIRQDFDQETSMTADYLTFYLDELDQEELSEIIDIHDDKHPKELLLLRKLIIARVGLYPDAPYFATFDYSIEIDDEPCNQLLVVNIKENGALHHITWES